MSSKQKTHLIAAVGKAVQAFQEATDLFDEAAAAKLGINRTDLRCLGVLAERGPLPVGEVGRAIGLTRGATTTALDRMERAGYARRVRDPSDRRGVLIEMTEAARSAAAEIWGPMVAEGNASLARMSEADLRTIQSFLEASRALQLKYLAGKSADEVCR